MCNLTKVKKTLCCSPAHSTTSGHSNFLLLPDLGTHSCLGAFAHALPTAWNLRRAILLQVFEHLASHSTAASHQNILCFVYVACVTL